MIPVSGLMFCGCVVGAGLLREWAWTGVPVIGCWAAADWSCERRGSCQVVVFSRWLKTHNKSKRICIWQTTATWWIRHTLLRTCFTCTTGCAHMSALTQTDLSCKLQCDSIHFAPATCLCVPLLFKILCIIYYFLPMLDWFVNNNCDHFTVTKQYCSICLFLLLKCEDVLLDTNVNNNLQMSPNFWISCVYYCRTR